MTGKPPSRKARTAAGKARPVWWLGCILLLAAICAIWSSLPALDSSPYLRVALFAAMGLAMLGTVFAFPGTTDQTALRLILVSAILLRIILWPAPVSDDVNRYLWEGKIVAAGENPYSAPADDARWQSRRDTLWERMNHRDRPTAYPPGIQWIMGATAAISPSLKSFKALALLGDLAALLLLLALLRQQGAPLRWAGFYAFNPVILVSFAAEAHFDSLMVAAMLAAILAAHSGKKSVWLWLGAAIQIKLVCLVLVPLFLTRKSIRSSWLLPLILILPGLPFLSALPNWLDGVREFSSSGAFNAPLFSLLASLGIPLDIVRGICFSIFGLLAAAICLARSRGLPLIDSVLWMLGALLACSPIVHFWYLAWLLPLAAIRPSFAWATLSITMAGYFISWETQARFGWWGFEYQVAAAIWLPWLATGIAQHRFLPKKLSGSMRLTASPGAPPDQRDPAIVIPVLRLDRALRELVHTLRAGTSPEIQIIIVSCDSAHAGQAHEIPGTRIITAPKGRGNQIAAGISATATPWVLIAHADATPPPGFAAHLRQAMAQHPAAALIVCGQRFNHATAGTLFIEALNELRVVFGGVAFGDQTMLIRRPALEMSGGFPAQPLMEDVEASMRLATRGQIVYLGREWEVSAKKWHGGFLTRFTLVIRLVASYQLARIRGRKQAAAISEKMYREYYSP